MRNSKIETIKVQGTREPILIDAEIVGDFAIHTTLAMFTREAERYHQFSVTYIPAGSVFFFAPNIEDCRKFIYLASKNLDWSIPKAALRDIQRACGARLLKEQCEGFDFGLLNRIRFLVCADWKPKPREYELVCF